MNCLFRLLFGRMPISGEIYIFDDGNGDDPWGSKAHRVEVLEIKNGWVRYRWLTSTMWQDERSTRGNFNFCYKLLDAKV